MEYWPKYRSLFRATLIFTYFYLYDMQIINPETIIRESSSSSSSLHVDVHVCIYAWRLSINPVKAESHDVFSQPYCVMKVAVKGESHHSKGGERKRSRAGNDRWSRIVLPPKRPRKHFAFVRHSIVLLEKAFALPGSTTKNISFYFTHAEYENLASNWAGFSVNYFEKSRKEENRREKCWQDNKSSRQQTFQTFSLQTEKGKWPRWMTYPYLYLYKTLMIKTGTSNKGGSALSPGMQTKSWNLGRAWFFRRSWPCFLFERERKFRKCIYHALGTNNRPKNVLQWEGDPPWYNPIVHGQLLSFAYMTWGKHHTVWKKSHEYEPYTRVDFDSTIHDSWLLLPHRSQQFCQKFNEFVICDFYTVHLCLSSQRRARDVIYCIICPLKNSKDAFIMQAYAQLRVARLTRKILEQGCY